MQSIDMTHGVKTTRLGDNIMITGATRAAVEAAVAQLRAHGATGVSQVEPFGAKRWAATYDDPDARAHECQIVNLGMQVMVKGPTQLAVAARAAELTDAGARLVSKPSAASGGAWVAVLDNVEQIHK